MKVICIDDSPGKGGSGDKPKFKYGQVVEAAQANACPDIQYSIPMDGRNWLKSRFIPLSSIDEKEFERNYQKEPAWIEAYNKL